MKRTDTREALIASAITVIAGEGLDKTTTKAVAGTAGLNEVYIYRYFSDKEDLLVSCFNALDEELVDIVVSHMSLMSMPSASFEARSRLLFTAVWRFLLGNSEKCRAYVRYYYSPYFKKHSVEAHRERFDGVLQQFRKVFREEANVWMLLNHVLNVMLDFSIKVFNGELGDNEDTTEHVFRLVYNSVSLYFKDYKENHYEKSVADN